MPIDAKKSSVEREMGAAPLSASSSWSSPSAPLILEIDELVREAAEHRLTAAVHVGLEAGELGLHRPLREPRLEARRLGHATAQRGLELLPDAGDRHEHVRVHVESGSP